MTIHGSAIPCDDPPLELVRTLVRTGPMLRPPAPPLDRFRADVLTRPAGQNVVTVSIMVRRPGSGERIVRTVGHHAQPAGERGQALLTGQQFGPVQRFG